MSRYVFLQIKNYDCVRKCEMSNIRGKLRICIKPISWKTGFIENHNTGITQNYGVKL